MIKKSTGKFNLHFTPEYWAAPVKFLQFIGPPFEITRSLNNAVSSCADHINKFEIFAELATDLQTKLPLDWEELKRDGHTSARRSRQFAAMVEVLVCELYSMLDGIRYTIFALYKNCRGVQQRSTSKLFSYAAERKYGPEFPEHIRFLLEEANKTWFPKIRRLRTAFTHGGLGTCSLVRDTGNINYINKSLGTNDNAHIIPNIVDHLNYLSSSALSLVNGIFEELYSQLIPISSEKMCGIHKNRIYMRSAMPIKNLNHMSGTCSSRAWFDSEPEFRCPIASECLAYSSSSSPMDNTNPEIINL